MQVQPSKEIVPAPPIYENRFLGKKVPIWNECFQVAD